MPDYTKPFPVIDEDNRDFWEGARRHELLIKRCGDCGYYIHYPKPFCPKCWSENVKPQKLSGRGTVFTFCIVRQQFQPGMPPPYVVALVTPEEAPHVRITTNIVDCAPEEVRIGMPVAVTFKDVAPDLTIPYFRPAAATGQRR
jgi:uncharacterized OB-fold protein